MIEASELPHLVIFDLGGTTVRDRGEVPAAFSDALHAAGIPFEPGEVKSWRGASKREVLRHLLTRHDGPDGTAAERLDEIYGRFRKGLEEQFSRGGSLSMPGIREAMERLRDADMHLAITSGFDRQVVDLILGSVDWSELIDTAVCSEDVPRGRPAPFMIFRAMEHSGIGNVHRVAVVGDTLLDLEAAWNAGAAYRIGVLTGAHDRATLRAGPFTHLIASATEVPRLWLA